MLRQNICGRKRLGKLFLARLGHRFGCVLRRFTNCKRHRRRTCIHDTGRQYKNTLKSSSRMLDENNNNKKINK